MDRSRLRKSCKAGSTARVTAKTSWIRRFAEMGIAYAAGQAARRGLFWVQLLVAPKA